MKEFLNTCGWVIGVILILIGLYGYYISEQECIEERCEVINITCTKYGMEYVCPIKACVSSRCEVENGK